MHSKIRDMSSVFRTKRVTLLTYFALISGENELLLLGKKTKNDQCKTFFK